VRYISLTHPTRSAIALKMQESINASTQKQSRLTVKFSRRSQALTFTDDP